MCIDKITNIDSDDIILPSNEYHSALIELAFDNIDRQKESLRGMGISHPVNGTNVQLKSLLRMPTQPTYKTVGKNRQETIRRTI